jgi:hypothetical protein
VGFDLAQTLAPCVSCTLSILLLNWSSFLQLLLTAGVYILLLYKTVAPTAMRLQNPVVSTITTVFTAFSSFGIIAVSTWFIFERWVFIRHRGTKWLRDSLDDCWIAAAEVFSRRRLLLLNKFVQPRTSTEIIISPSDSWSSLTHAPSSTMRTSSYNRSGSLRTRSPSPMTPASPEAPHSAHNVPEEANGTTQACAMPPRRARFVQAMRSVIIAQQGPSGTSRASLFSPEVTRQEELLGLIRSSRVARLAPKLRDFAPTQEFDAHQALVRHLQFSPNGNFLATSRSGFYLDLSEPSLTELFRKLGQHLGHLPYRSKSWLDFEVYDAPDTICIGSIFSPSHARPLKFCEPSRMVI